MADFVFYVALALLFVSLFNLRISTRSRTKPHASAQHPYMVLSLVENESVSREKSLVVVTTCLRFKYILIYTVTRFKIYYVVYRNVASPFWEETLMIYMILLFYRLGIVLQF